MPQNCVIATLLPDTVSQTEYLNLYTVRIYSKADGLSQMNLEEFISYNKTFKISMKIQQNCEAVDK